jgi:surface carbohydrate biosynthesis protein
VEENINPQIDVLNLEWVSYKSRDNIIALLVCNYLRQRGLNVVNACIFEGKQLIYKLRPKLLFIANGVGSPQNYEVVKFAKKFGCIVVTSTSEGNIKPFMVDQMTWGWNQDKIMHEDINFQWSNRAKELILYKYPELREKIIVSGSVGLDIYPMVKDHQEDIAQKVKEKFNIPKDKPVIGYGCWDFGAYYPDDPRFEQRQKVYSPEEIQRFKSDGKLSNEILLQFIQSLSDYHFLIKEHPGSLLGDLASAIEGVRELENVTVIKNEESIMNCLSTCEFWMGYETTTALEAWLLGKTTILINPSGVDFKRDSLYKGSVVVKDLSSLLAINEEYFDTGRIKAFDKKGTEREEEIKAVSEYVDGLNHQRVGNEIINLIENSEQNLRATEVIKKEVDEERSSNNSFLNLLMYRKRNTERIQRLKDFNSNDLKELRVELMRIQLKFYKKLELVQ